MLLEMSKTMSQKNSRLPDYIMKKMELHIVIFFLTYAIFMAVIAIYFSTDIWIFFKTAGLYLVFFIFMIAEFLFIRFQLKKEMKNRRAAELYKQF